MDRQSSWSVRRFVVVGSEDLVQLTIPFVAVAPLEVLLTPVVDALSHDRRIAPPIDSAQKPTPDQVQQLPHHAEHLE